MLPVFEGKPADRKVPMFWRTHVSSAQDRVAVRVGDWKIVGNDVLTDFMLFNIKEDWQEKNDLATSEPEKFAQRKATLLKTWEDLAAEGPNQWWEGERNKPRAGAKLPY